MSDIRDKLKKRLAGRTAGQIGGGAQRQLPGGTQEAAQKLAERAEARQAAPMTVYMVFDTTNSMSPYIDAVAKCAREVGNQILDAGKGIEAVVLGVSDHTSRPEVGRRYKTDRETALDRNGAERLGDYGQTNTPTTEASVLETQVNTLVQDGKIGAYGSSNGDTPEAYECLAHDLAGMIVADRAENPAKKHTVIFFGDSYPHGVQSKSHEDLGCPDGHGPEQLGVLASVASQSYWVDCNDPEVFHEWSKGRYVMNGEDDFRDHTFGQVRGRENAQYVRFADAKKVLAPAITAMVKKAQGATQLREYLAALPAGTATKVAGLLE